VPGGAPKLVYPTIVQNSQFGCLALALKQARGLAGLFRGRASFFLRQPVAPLAPHAPWVANFGEGWFLSLRRLY
jgi:hypothetical protein